MSLKQRRSSPTSGRETRADETAPPAVVTTDSSPAGSPLRKIIVRSVVGLAMLGFFVAVLNSRFVTVILPFLIILLQVVVFKEIVSVRYNAVKEMKLAFFRTLNWFFLFITLFYFYGKNVVSFTQEIGILTEQQSRFLRHYHMWTAFSMFVAAFMAFIYSLKKGLYKYQFKQFAWTLMTLLLVVAQSNFALTNLKHGLYWLVFPAACIICNDISAYYWGITFGRKIIQRKFISLSPNKTWEGFLGAFITTLGFAVLFTRYVSAHDWWVCPVDSFALPETCVRNPVWATSTYEVPQLLVALLGQATVSFAPIYVHALLLAVFASLIAPFGGFFASGMKRAYEKKDFDTIFPGHGGFYDRFDCQLIMVLCTYVHFKTFVATSVASVALLLSQISELSVIDQEAIYTELGVLLSKPL